MKRGIQKTVSVLLAIVMMLAVAVPAFASEEKTAPVIVVSGMASFPLINEENGKSAFPMENDVLTENIMKMILPLLGSAVTNQWEIFAKYGVGPIHDLFEAIRCDRNGDSIYKVAPKAFPMSADNYAEFTNPVKENGEIGVVNAIGDKIGLDNTYFFYYDWRMNPMSLADDLNETVEKVKAERNSDKVSLVALSFGGMITSSYIYKYGTDSLENVVYASTAFNGVDIVGQLFAGNIEIEIGAALDYLSTFMQSKEILAAVFGISSKALSEYGVVGEKAINNYLSKLIDVLKYPAYSEVFMDTYAAFQGIWCLMPIEYYEQSKEFMKQTADLSEEFISEVDEYMYNVQGNLENLLDKAEADGVSVYIVGAYGYSGIPLTPSSENQTDTLIDTDLMTGNSMVAPFGKRLNSIAYSDEDFCREHNHVSQDNIIDAGGCFFPEQTWFIKNMGHVGYTRGTYSGDLITWLATSTEKMSVTTTDGFPQFVNLNMKTGEFTSLTEGIKLPSEAQNEPTALDFFKTLFKKIVDFILRFLNLDLVR